MTDAQVPIEVDFGGPFTANEVVDLQRMTGASLAEIAAGSTGEIIRAVAWIVGRRNNPTLTLEQAGELMIRLDTDGGS